MPPHIVALSQVIVKEEGAILEDGATDGAAEFMNLLHGFVRYEGVTATDGQGAITFQNRVKRIERRILAVVITRPMKLIATGFCRGVDDRTGGATDFRRWNAGRDLELGDGIGIGKHADAAELRLVVIDAVEREVVVGRALAIDDQRTAA